MDIRNLDQITKVDRERFDASKLHKFTETFFQHWRWLLVSIVACILAALVFLRYQTPAYKINASILVRDDTKGSDFGDAIVLQGLGLSSTGKSNVDNEVEVLRSRTLAESVVRDLQLHVQYFTTGNIKTSQLYLETPVIMQFFPTLTAKVRTERYTIRLTKTGYELSDEERAWQAAFGDTLLLPGGAAVLRRTNFPFIPDNTYTIRIADVDQCVKNYRKSLHISATNKQVSLINLSLTDILPKKGEAILKRHLQNYLNNSINDKNRIADSTIAFIDHNLRIVSAELLEAENRIEKFRRSNHLTDLDVQNRLLIENSSQTNNERKQYLVQLTVIDLLQNFLKRNPESVIPASLVMYDASFTDLINRYNGLQMSRKSALLGNTEAHPLVVNIKEQLMDLRQNIEIAIEAKKSSLKISVAQLDTYHNQYQQQLGLMPAKESTYLDYNRQQQIKQELYIFLLKKRVETSLSKSSTLGNGRIIDTPKADSFPYTPNRQLILMMALFIGLGIPSALLYGKETFNAKVTTEADIEANVSAPILAKIGHNTGTTMLVFDNLNYNVVAEQFRVLRSNLQFLNLNEQKIILLTSSMGGEGKSFITINLAIALALMEKKVLLMEFDFRKPKIAAYLGLNHHGITDALITGVDIEQFIQNSGKADHFDVLVCGSIPPNPAELLATNKISAFITTLKTKYDYILFDTPPIGIVTDAQILSQYADATLFIIRLHHTFKHQLNEIQELISKKRFSNLNLIVNDVPASSSDVYRYTYQTDSKPRWPVAQWLNKSAP
jgi:tyrosine-protein kinase Etk/Wzc